MTPRLRLAQAARQLQPALQGQLDGLCGLYAIINAIELVLYPAARLMPRHRKQLFATGVRYLSSRRQLHFTITTGMADELWIDLAAYILAQHPDLPARSQRLQMKRSVTAAVESIVSALKHGQPVTLSLSGAYDHFTVISGFTPTRFQLFDSYGLRSIEQRSLGLIDQGTARHRITHSAVLTFMRR